MFSSYWHFAQWPSICNHIKHRLFKNVIKSRKFSFNTCLGLLRNHEIYNFETKKNVAKTHILMYVVTSPYLYRHFSIFAHTRSSKNGIFGTGKKSTLSEYSHNANLFNYCKFIDLMWILHLVNFYNVNIFPILTLVE